MQKSGITGEKNVNQRSSEHKKRKQQRKKK
jgi:hypothetical protein